MSDGLARRLLAAVAGGEFRPGARLPTEKQLSERFQVSRAVVREAIARLKSEGIVETRQGAGAFVAAQPGRASFRLAPDGHVTPDELGHVFELRSAVEAKAAELAAKRRGAADLAALRDALEAMRAALRTGSDGAAADDAFHAAVATASGNPHLARFAGFLGQQFSETRQLTWAPGSVAAGKADAALAEHAALLDAIEAGDPAAAAAAARNHVARAAARFGIAIES